MNSPHLDPNEREALQKSIQGKVRAWFGEPVLAVEDDLIDLILTHNKAATKKVLTELLAELPRTRVIVSVSIEDHKDVGEVTYDGQPIKEYRDRAVGFNDALSEVTALFQAKIKDMGEI